MSDYQGNIIIKNPATPTGPSAYGSAPGMWKLNEVAYWIKQGVWPNPAITPDQYYPYVSLLLSTTSLGNANNNLFVDSSGAFNPISRNGNTTQGSFTPYGASWSNYFDGNSSTWISVSDASAFDFGTGDFTIECFAFVTAQSGSFSMIAATTGVNQYWGFGSVGPGGMTMFSGAVDIYSGAGNTPALNTWNHLVWQRSGGVASMYLNGVRVYNASYTADFGSSATGFKVGRSDTYNNYYTNGFISNLRVVKGSGVYSGATITVPTAPLTAISGTSLLTCQSNRFIDNSSNAFAITVNGNTAVTEFSPFSPAYPGITYNQSDIQYWSGYLNGSSYWTVPTSTALDVWDSGSGSFTVEAWIYATASIGNNVSIVAKAPNNGSPSWSPGWAFQVYNGYLNVNTPGDSRLFNSNTTSVPLNQWVHCVLVKSGSTVSIYQNGTRVGTITNSTAYSNTTDAVAIGVDRNFAGSKLTGYVSNVRMVKGTAVYDPSQSTLTVPTAPLTAVSGTSLLTLQSAAFSDNSGNNYVVTPVSAPTVTGNNPFQTGYYSNYFDGSGDYLSAPSNAAFDCSTGDWTIEGWVNITTRTTNYPAFFSNNRGAFATTPPGLAITVSNSDSASYNDKFVFAWGGGGFSSPSAGTAYLLVANATNDKNTWYHLAVVRNGTSIKMYRNGTEVASATISAGSTFDWGYNGALIGGGNWDGANSYMNGYVSNFRFVKGTAVYTAAFTPPTSPLTAISGTSLLTCQSGRFIDNSTNAFTITVNGNTAVQSFDPFYTSTIASNGGSMYFDGSGDYLTSPTNVNYDFASSNFTIEGWFYFTNSTANALQTLYTNYTSFSSAGSIFWGKHTSNSGYMTVWFSNYSTGSPLLAETSYPPNNSWVHYALVRNGNTFTLYRNGVSTASASWSGAATSGANAIWVGAAGDAVTSYNFPGYMNGFRITKGTAVYTAAFTPPTAPLTPTAATTLLVNGMNAGIYDATTINDMETVGNAQVSTAVSKFGGSSVAFDGNGDYVSIPSNNEITLGSGDFTIEFWLYLNSNSIVQILYDQRNGNGAYPVIYMPNASIRYYVNTADRIIGANLNTATWYHIAICRSGTSTRMFIDGTQSGSTYTDTTNYLAAPLFIGADKGPGNFMNGYIDDLRITKGVARYTANFTPPTQAFPPY